MKIVIFGGSGFIGTALCKELIFRNHSVTAISRSGRPNKLTEDWANNVHWLHSNILNDTIWQAYVQNADWVIDAIGILKEKPTKNITYERFIIDPVRQISTFLNTQETPAKFLFLSANAAPFPFKKYMTAKLKAEQIIAQQTTPYTIIYPSLVMDKHRPLSVLGGKAILFFKNIPSLRQLLNKYTPLARQKLIEEIIKVLEGNPSFLTTRQN